MIYDEFLFLCGYVSSACQAVMRLQSCWLPSEGVVLTARDRAKRIMCPLVRRQPPPSAITAAAAGSSSPAATASPGLDKQAWLIAEPVVFYCMPDGGCT